jgi:hypothetical protein
MRTTSGNRGEFQGGEDEDESTRYSKEWQGIMISGQDLFQLIQTENHAG